jgi:hypothetical protein
MYSYSKCGLDVHIFGKVLSEYTVKMLGNPSALETFFCLLLKELPLTTPDTSNRAHLDPAGLLNC